MEFLQEAPPPQNKQKLLSFLSIIQLNSEFIPNLSPQTANLGSLGEKYKKIYMYKNTPVRIQAATRKDFIQAFLIATLILAKGRTFF